MITTITITHENSDFISENKKNIDDQILIGGLKKKLFKNLRNIYIYEILVI